jgi:LPS-assembly protein
LPYARVHLGYPLAASGESVEQLIEPVAAYMISAGTGASPLYPNEDSLEADLNFANLFSFNRFVGDDRREGGQRLAYGMRYAINSYDGPGAEFFLGQNYRISNENPYPYGSGLSDKFSDYVGQLVLHPVSWFDLGYRFRLDNDNLSRRSQNIGFAVGRPLLTFTTSYDMLDRTTDPAAPERVLGEYASFGLRSRVSRYWNVALSHSQGINPEPGPRQTALAMTYEDECFSFQALAERDHTRLESMGGGTRVLFRLVFRNIGEVSVPVLSSTTRENKNAP